MNTRSMTTAACNIHIKILQNSNLYVLSSIAIEMKLQKRKIASLWYKSCHVCDTFSPVTYPITLTASVSNFAKTSFVEVANTSEQRGTFVGQPRSIVSHTIGWRHWRWWNSGFAVGSIHHLVTHLKNLKLNTHYDSQQ